MTAKVQAGFTLMMLFAGLTSAQAPARQKFAKATEATVVSADTAVLSNIQITKAPNGSWRCTGKTGACSPAEVQALSRSASQRTTSGVKSVLQTPVLVVAPDGTISCKDSENEKPCTAGEIDNFASALKTRHDTAKNAINNVR